MKFIEKEKIIKNINFKENIIIFITMIVLLSIVLLSFWPGIFTIDGNVQWSQIEQNYIKNNHPFFSTFFWWLLSRIWYSKTSLIIFQILLLSIIWTSICNELKTKNNFFRRWLYTVVMCFVPIVFFYSITAWKDIIYSYMWLLIILMIYIGIKKEFKYSYLNLFVINLALVFVWSYRYNAIIAVILMLITLLIIFIKHKIQFKKILIGFAMFILILGLFKIPERIMCHPDKSEAGNDIALFILASLVKENKIDKIEDLNIINEIYNIEKLKEEYNPYCINSISFSQYYNRESSKKYSSEILKMLFKYTLKHPIVIFKHYLKSDNLLIGLRFKDGYIYIYQFDFWETKYSGNFDGLVEPIFSSGYDFYSKIINLSTGNITLRKFYLPAFSLYVSIVLMIIYVKKVKNKKFYLLLLPMIYNTLSLIPINIAQDLRYVYINYLTLLLFVIPLFVFKINDIVIDNNIIDNRSKKYKKTLIIVPAYNEELNLKKTINDIKENSNFDYIIINDCSKDNTLKICKDNNFNYLSLPVNYGLTSCIQLGMKYALKNDYDIAIQFDGDGQHKAKYLKNLVNAMITEDYDVVIGSRFINKKKERTLRMFGSNIISLCIKLTTGQVIKDPTSGMRAYNKETIEEFVKDPSLTPEPDTIAYLIKKGKKIKEIQVEMQEREYGESYLKPLKSVEYMANIIASILFFRNFQK